MKRWKKCLAAVVAVGLMVSATVTSVPQNMRTVLAEDLNEANSVELVNYNTIWKYLDNGTDPAGDGERTSWTLAGYDDSTWKTNGKTEAKFGAKKGVLAAIGEITPSVLLNQYIDENSDNGNVPAYFFRTKFTLETIPKNTELIGTLKYDDGAAVYLNGTKIYSTDTFESNLAYGGSNEGAGDPGEATFTVNTGNLKVGENVLAVEVHQATSSSSDVYFEMSELKLVQAEGVDPSAYIQNSVLLTVGSDETSRNITWYADTITAGKVQYAEKNGDTFPTEYSEAEAVAEVSNVNDFYTNQAVLSGLKQDTEYVYRLVNEETVSEVYSFTTGSEDSFSFALVGDPQIGAGSRPSDIEGWNATLDVIANELKVDFLLSVGDQVNTASSEAEYEGYVDNELASLASATTIGNHDSSSNAYGQHFNLPNESTQYGTTTAGGDYWFVYNNTLFMCINSNDRSTAEHKAFLEEAIAANPDVTWKTVVFHHSIYSTASHWSDGDIISRRDELPPVFTELDIDVALMGHDHVYTRTYMMDGYTPDSDAGVQSSVINPTGILYLTANSASGSKYYNLQNAAIDAGYAAVYDQSYRETVTDVQVTDSSYTLTTYYTDDMTMLDTFTIYKTDKTELEDAIKNVEVILDKEAEYTAESWRKFEAAFEAANEVFANEDVLQEEIDAACEALKNTVDALEPVAVEEETPDAENPDKEQDKEDSDGKNQETDADNQDKEENDTPQTGDMTNAASWLMLAMASGSIMVLLAVSYKKRKQA